RVRGFPFHCSVLIFFFSSRRRHTRFSRDWSSDVCTQDPIDGLPGQISSSYLHKIETRIADGELRAGLYAIAGTSEKSAKHPTSDFTSTPQKALGIVHLDPSYVLPEGATAVVYPDKKAVSIIRTGKVWVKPEAEHPGAL